MKPSAYQYSALSLLLFAGFLFGLAASVGASTGMQAAAFLLCALAFLFLILVS